MRSKEEIPKEMANQKKEDDIKGDDIMKKDNILVSSGFPGVNFKMGDHICHFYYGVEHLITKIVPFLDAGLDNGEKCLIYLRPEIKQKVEQLLRKKAKQAGGTLKFLDINQIFQIYAHGTAEEIEDFYIKMVNDAAETGFKMLRISGQADYVLDRVGPDRMLFVEETVDSFLSKYPIVALCEYSFDFNESRDFIWHLQKIHSYYLSSLKLSDSDNRHFELLLPNKIKKE